MVVDDDEEQDEEEENADAAEVDDETQDVQPGSEQ